MKTNIIKCLLLCQCSTVWISASGFASPNLIVNGGFETPQVPDNSWAAFYASDVFNGWAVEYGAVNIHATNYFASALGSQSLDLNDWDIGAVFQEVETVAGEVYRLRFAFGGNTVSVGHPSTGPAVKRMEVLWGTNVLGLLEHDVTDRSPSNVGWREISFLVLGTGFDRVTFRSLTPGSAGPAIDQVSLTVNSEPVPLAGGVSIRLLSDSVSVCWPTVLDCPYQVQCAERVDADVWTYLGTSVLGDGSMACISDTLGTNEMRFFRVLEW